MAGRITFALLVVPLFVCGVTRTGHGERANNSIGPIKAPASQSAPDSSPPGDFDGTPHSKPNRVTDSPPSRVLSKEKPASSPSVSESQSPPAADAPSDTRADTKADTKIDPKIEDAPDELRPRGPDSPQTPKNGNLPEAGADGAASEDYPTDGDDAVRPSTPETIILDPPASSPTENRSPSPAKTNAVSDSRIDESVTPTSDPIRKRRRRPRFSGVEKCRMCHSADSIGQQFQKWHESKHANAYWTLFSPQSLEIAKRLNLPEPPHENKKCLACHTTGYGERAGRFEATFRPQDGVQCESCHGAGSNYSRVDIMMNRERAIQFGLQIPTEQTCRGCHNPYSPTYKPFTYKKSLAEIAHPRPPKAKTP